MINSHTGTSDSAISLADRRMFTTTLFMVLVGLTACEEDLVSRDLAETPFSMYGVLSPDLPIQSIRLYETESFPTLGSAQPLDVEVFSTDLDTGERVEWRDSVVVDPNGQAEHIFWAPFRAQFGHAYRVEAVRPRDGTRSLAEIRVPERVTVRIADDRDASALRVAIEGGGTRILDPELHYKVADLPGCTIIRDRFSYQGREQRMDDGWRIDLNTVADNRRILFDCAGITVFGSGPCPHFRLLALELRMLVGNAEWDPPDGEFDPALLSQPNMLTNVQNGLGFIGAGYRITTRLHPSKEAVEHACFEYALDG